MDKMANETMEDVDLSKEVTCFLDKNVGTEKSSTSKVYSLLQDALKKKKCLETEVSFPGNSLKDGTTSLFWVIHVFTCAWANIRSKLIKGNIGIAYY